MQIPRPLWKRIYSNQKPRRHLLKQSPKRQNAKIWRGWSSGATRRNIRVKLPPQEKEELVEFLKRNIDVFAWDACDAPGINPAFICHHLNVNPSITPKKQSPRCPSREHAEAIREKVMKLKRAGAIKEVSYPEWLANIVVVKKKNGKWRVCVHFTDLNIACPKDPFPMPRIDQLVDATTRHPRMSFLDVFQGYHQIPLALKDQEKIAFVTPIGNYHYKVMLFGLRTQVPPITG